MRTSLKALTVAATLIAGIAVAPALYAQSDGNTTGATTTPMAQNTMPMAKGEMPMGQGNMMGKGHMMGMMKKMMKAHTSMMKQMMEEHEEADSDKKQ